MEELDFLVAALADCRWEYKLAARVPMASRSECMLEEKLVLLVFPSECTRE